ncbi:metal ABC transporter ATP-binding protein [Enteractinococcus coprophilus]|uniref:Iron/zinc/copper transport system ATP-binding protein/manganese/zinc/iron transport system ATP-binding protein n=1 Tax=Enteractinococcus coprophilus TaxID=1027633 RepID=A0A543AIH9_9MICC|nr:metal ABC transporter ATP-binding protein [Enteractinococcus coprophilus]TQL72378.1 iron/zinc/copper transport system ATP-binding protein/manganese/zinc/iron transport system ATP- binding protein [Enteractinococcus coprophilus]
MPADVLTIDNLHVSYRGVKAVEGLTLSIPAATMTCIVGPNGSGKSTTLKAALGLVERTAGAIRFFDQRVDKVRQRIGYVPQRSTTDWDFPINVFDTVLLGTYPRLRLFQRPGTVEREVARRALMRVHMEEYAHRQIADLSGGQQQRVFIARALAQQADILLLDEPLMGIDAASELNIIEILRELVSSGKTVVMVHHDLSNVENYFDHIIMINKRLIAQGPVAEALTAQNLTATFGANLLGIGE